MAIDIATAVADLRQMTVGQLQARYAEVFGERTLVRHKTWLTKRIAWRLQALAEGDLSERARRRAAELANDADVRMTPPKTSGPAPDAVPTDLPYKSPSSRKNPLLVPGALLSRPYKGRTLQVKVVAQGFLYDSAIYPSLSAVAKAITGSHCNGHLFFRLCRKGGSR
jgi:Protein of unknown function (DUF2924)